MLDEQSQADAGNRTTDQEPNSTTEPHAPTEQPAAEAAADQPAAERPATGKRAPRKSTKKAAAAAVDGDQPPAGDEAGETPPPAKKTAARRTRKTAAAPPAAESPAEGGDATAAAADTATDTATATDTDGATEGEAAAKPAKKAAKRTRKAPAKKAAAAPPEQPEPTSDADVDPAAADTADTADSTDTAATGAPTATAPLFQPPEPVKTTRRRSTKKTAAAKATTSATDEAAAATEPAAEPEDVEEAAAVAAGAPDEADGAPTVDAEVETTDGAPDESGSEDDEQEDQQDESAESEGDSGPRRRRRRGGRRRRRGSGGEGSGDQSGSTDDESGNEQADESSADSDAEGQADGTSDGASEGQSEGGGSSRRRRRRRRSGDSDTDGDDAEGTVTRVRKSRSAEDEITSFSGSTRLEAKKQRRREGREAGRRRAPIISEAEFLARRESVDRTMVIRQKRDLTQIAVLEDKVLVEHYVARESQTSLIGNVYLGRVQNVLPSMEAAFIDIGRGRNAVLYAGEVNWESLGAKEGNQRKIEQVLKPGQAVLVQVTKDPIGHKGARLTSQISLPGRFLVYVPGGSTSGISRKLPDNERSRLKTLLKEIVPESAGVIVRTAAEGASEDELTRDVERLKALWADIESKVESGNAPQVLYAEPDLTLKVVRDLFTEDFGKLVVSGDDAWDMVQQYVEHIAPDLVERLERHDDFHGDAFAEYRIDEQIAKALDRKVWLPSGGSLIIDRTEAMTVVDVNTGKFTGSGGNLEETVTKNNLEAAEEIVRQLRLRDIGGIIVIDFIDMVLENNRDLVLRRLIECLGRDRTRHQVAEVTSLGLVQMTRKRIGTGLLEAFSEPCEHCQGRGLHVHQEPVEQKRKQTEEEPRRSRRGRGGRGRSDDQDQGGKDQGKDQGTDQPDSKPAVRRPTPAEFAAMAAAAEESDHHHREAEVDTAELPASEPGQSSEQSADALTADATAEPSPEPTPEPTPEAAAETSADESAGEQQQEPVTPPPPAAPRIVTSVRRIGARRPAGPPSGAAAGAVAAADPSE